MTQKIVRLNQQKLKEIIENSIKGVLKEKKTDFYQLTDLDELMEYMWLKPSVTNLKEDIFVDDGGAYKRNKHSLLIFVRNGFGRECNEFIPISVSNDPKILDNTKELNISEVDLIKIIEFIKSNEEILHLMADEKINIDEFVGNITHPSLALSENKNLLNEYATLRERDSHLPTTIWLDEGGAYQGHAPRIKFKASNEQRTTREFSTMTLEEEPRVENLPKRRFLSNKDIDQIALFVKTNLKLLLALANGEIDYRTQFLPNMIKI